MIYNWMIDCQQKYFIIKKGLGPDTRPLRGDIVTADISLYAKDSLIEENKDIKFIVGDLDVLQGIDLVSHLMEKEEKAKVIIPPKLAFREKGCFPCVASDTDIECDIEIKEVQHVDINSLSASEKLKYGNDKRLRGNYFYERGDFVDAVHCYDRAIAYLDSIQDFYRKDLIDELKIVGMSSRHHIDDFMRGRIIGKIEEGRKITDVAKEFDITHSVVSRLWK
ncbi:peptidylprolyl isomerase [Trichonephila clavipes]|nr:peptidylprolyl isomerase [Trichonephila clavipes]